MFVFLASNSFESHWNINKIILFWLFLFLKFVNIRLKLKNSLYKLANYPSNFSVGENLNSELPLKDENTNA
jgi:hypothetical protein